VLFPLDDLIVAPGAAPGAGARAVVRVGGPGLAGLLHRLQLTVEPDVRRPWSRAVVMTLVAGERQVAVPVQLSVWPTSRSYIGQPLAELHLPGSPPVVEAVLAACHRAGARQAERGEFTLRAFLSGKIDLTQAEAVLGVIEAESQAELTAALSQLSGGLAREIEAARNVLLDLLADLEAGLDFADEHLEFVTHDVLTSRLAEVRSSVESLRSRSEARLRSNPVPVVVLAGKPNAGKSTLFNRLAGRQAALVSAAAGTTRDYLEATFTLAGREVALVDTAGWERPDVDGDDAGAVIAESMISESAQRFRDDQWRRADLILACVSADEADWLGAASELLREVASSRSPLLLLRTRSDLANPIEEPPSELATNSIGMVEVVDVSGVTGDGLEALRKRITKFLSVAGGGDSLVATTAARCRDSLDSAVDALDRARAIAGGEVDQELLAIEIRETLDALGRLVGAVHTDDLLDRVFSRFCIGK
jgi:tRNA modification GTPase